MKRGFLALAGGFAIAWGATEALEGAGLIPDVSIWPVMVLTGGAFLLYGAWKGWSFDELCNGEERGKREA